MFQREIQDFAMEIPGLFQRLDLRLLYTGFTEQTESFPFHHFTEETALSACSVYKKRVLASLLEKTIMEILGSELFTN